MLVADIKELPAIGEYAVMANAVHGEVEKLKAVLHMPDDEIANIIHVFFASDNEEDNIHEEQGVRYYAIRTYVPLAEEE